MGPNTTRESAFPVSRIPAVNVATVPQRSPLRYPGGKTWLVPHVRDWLIKTKPKLLIEPFAGGGIVSLTAVMEGLVERCVMIEIDRDVAAFWHATLRDGANLAKRIKSFSPTRERVNALEKKNPGSLTEHAFRTFVLNRTRNSGILAPGASLTKNGENGKGISSRWYPDTLAERIEAVHRHADKIAFCEGDAMQLLEPLLHGRRQDAAVFVDPPYTAGGKRAGSRLYSHSKIDHERVFKTLADRQANFLMTYDCSVEIANLIAQYGFHAARVRMKNAHHETLSELIITREPFFT